MDVELVCSITQLDGEVSTVNIDESILHISTLLIAVFISSRKLS